MLIARLLPRKMAVCSATAGLPGRGTGRALDSAQAIGKEAARRALSRLNARKLSTRAAPVIFEAPVARGLFSAFISAISGAALYRRASFLLDRLGERVFAPQVQIEEQPHLPRELGQRAV